MRTAVLLLALPLAAAAQGGVAPDSLRPPPIAREFRGLWVATVNNMDWPSRPDLTTAEQKRELLAILDRAASLHMNAVIFQVRPEADALYRSRIEPWSRYLTGRQGRAPSPAWDPLAFAVAESHKRGLELHAWFNPYRAAFWKDRPRSPSHVSRVHPDWVVPYAQFLWMDPSQPEVRERMIHVVLDVVRRYDIDGVHIDDYFYPYPEVNQAGERIEFPDAAQYARYQRAGGRLSRADWRRRNVDEFVKDFYSAVKAVKKWVKVGISPFGIWRPGNPPGIEAGIDQYAELFSDVRAWVRDGTLDYVAPQLYWPVRPAAQSFPPLLEWWVEQNVKGRHVWPGLALYKLPIAGPRKMTPDDIVEEIGITRATPGATGHLLFDARILMDNVDGIADSLASEYAEPALVPASPWLDAGPPASPSARITLSGGDTVVVRFAPADRQPVRWWAVQVRAGGRWRTTVLPGTSRAHILKGENADADVVSVAAVDRTGNISAARLLRPPSLRRTMRKP